MGSDGLKLQSGYAWIRTVIAALPNRPVNADARASAVLWISPAARAGYWER
jgi:hypothetical protein